MKDTLLYEIADAILLNIDSVKDINYTDCDNNFIITLESNKKYKIILKE